MQTIFSPSSGDAGLKKANGFIPLFLFGAAAFFVLWIVFNAPAIINPWWAADDYAQFTRTPARWYYTAFIQGRPFLWPLGKVVDFFRETFPEHGGMYARLVQGGLHALLASLTGIILCKEMNSKKFMFAVLPFVLWPFNGEATYWLACLPYPFAAFLSVIGVCLFAYRPPSLLTTGAGICLISVAILANQSACLAGLMVLLMIAICRTLRSATMRDLVKPALITVASYAIGTGISLAMAFNMAFKNTRAATKISDFSGVLEHFTKAWKYLSSSFLPTWIGTLHAIFFATCLLIFLLSFFEKKSRSSLIYTISAAVLFFLLFTTPLLPRLSLGYAVSTSPRTMYLLPLVFVMSIVFLLQSKWIVTRFIVPALFLGSSAYGYWGISYANAQEYVNIYRNDAMVFARLVSIATAENIQEITVIGLPLSDCRNTSSRYKPILYPNSSAKGSVFTMPSASAVYISYFSSGLKENASKDMKDLCRNLCPPPDDYYVIMETDDKKILCMYP